MNFLLIWGIIAILIIVILMFILMRAYKSHQLNLILYDSTVAIAPSAFTPILSDLKESHNSMIQIHRLTAQYTSPLPSNVFELTNNATAFTYVIVGNRYKVSSLVKNTAASHDSLSIVDYISGKMFKIIAPTAASGLPSDLLTTKDSIIIPFTPAFITAAQVNANLVFDKNIITSVATVQLVLISYKKV